MQFQNQQNVNDPNNFQEQIENMSQQISSATSDAKSEGGQFLSKPLLFTNDLNLPTNLDDFDGPTLFYCEKCKLDSISICEYKSSASTYCCAFLLFLLFNIVGLIIPFCVNTCKDRYQICPNCKHRAGTLRYQVCLCS